MKIKIYFLVKGLVIKLKEKNERFKGWDRRKKYVKFRILINSKKK